jgi:hypothetical protein
VTKETKLKLLLDFSGSIKVLRARIKTMLELRCDPSIIMICAFGYIYVVMESVMSYFQEKLEHYNNKITCT